MVPYHQGAVAVFRELGVWSEADQAHNDALLERQAVLSAAWARMADSDLEGDAFRAAWMAVREEALTAAGFDPIWR